MLKQKSGLRFLLILAFSLLLSSIISACSILQPAAVPQVTSYQLQGPDRVAVAQNQTGHYVLLVMPPTANEIYQSKNMLYSNHPYQIRPYAKNQWAAPPSQMFLPLLVTSLRHTQRFHAVVAPPFSGLADFQMTTQLQHFEQVFNDGNSYFNLVILATLINNTSHRVIAEHLFAIHVAAPENTPYGGVVAANQATATFTAQLSKWCVRHTLRE